MADTKLVKTIMDAATLTGLAAGIGWIGKKVLKQNMNYVKFTAVMAGSIAPWSSISRTRWFSRQIEKKKLPFIWLQLLH